MRKIIIDFVVVITISIAISYYDAYFDAVVCEHSCALPCFTHSCSVHCISTNRLIWDIICNAKYNFLIQWQLTGKWPKIEWSRMRSVIALVTINFDKPWFNRSMHHGRDVCLSAYLCHLATGIPMQKHAGTNNHCDRTKLSKKKNEKRKK